MTTVYGKFESVRELYKTHSGSVWSARPRDSHEEARACLKMVQLDELMLEHRDTSVAESLLVSAAIQQTMANKSEFWAPVYELGSDGTNAFFVSQLFPRTLQTLVESETKLTSAELKTIMLAIVDGLIDLETAYHRQHGNLKPANVMLAARTHISPGGMLLADPDSVADNVPSMTRAPDTKAMGQILYALVTHKPYTGARFPLADAIEWKQLGSSGKAWFILCQRLLDTFSKQGLTALESVRIAIAEIRPTRRSVPRPVYAAVLLGLAAAAAYQYRAQLPGYWNHSRDAVSALVTKYVHPNTTTVASVAPSGNTHPAKGELPARKSDSTAVAPVVRSGLAPAEPAQPETNLSQLRPPAAVPISRPEESPPLPKPNQALATIRSAPIPDLHSLAAAQEFDRDRNNFAARHSAHGPVNLVEWDVIYKAVTNLDMKYPQPAPGPAWPPQLADELTSRRDTELARAIDAVFNDDNPDPSVYTAELATVAQTAAAATAARSALGSIDLIAADSAVKDFDKKMDALAAVDADVASTFAEDRKDFRIFTDARTSTDRMALLIASGNDSVPLAVRLRSWMRLSKAGETAWPADLATLAADRAQGDRFADLAKDVPATLALISAEQQSRLNGFFSSLRDVPAAHDAAKQAVTAQLASLAPLYPQWFQYDVMLAKLQESPNANLPPDQVKAFLDAADKMHAANAAQLRSAFTAVAQPPRTLADAGPVLAGCKLAPGSDANHRTYLLDDESLEFLRVHQPAANANAAVDCYLCTTETPVSLLQTLLDKAHPARLKAARSLNGPSTSSQPAMRIWSFGTDGVQLDNDDYRDCFLLSPTAHLPAQDLTPEMAMYLARLVGCRLPTSDEWHAALSQVTQPTSDPAQWGFAMRNWKLRDSDFTAAMNRAANSPPPKYWPNEDIFRNPAEPAPSSPAADTRIWSAMSLATLAGQIAPVPNINQPDGGDALPMAAGHLGFREVDDGAHYTGVFHDLIGNAAEFVLDVQPGDSERVDVSDAAHAADAIKKWFTPARESCVAIIGASALSPPNLDPRTAYKLSADAPRRTFSDVGFRLAFTDPRSLIAVDPATLRAVAVQHTEYVTAESVTRAQQP
jgi:hypothetical protein